MIGNTVSPVMLGVPEVNPKHPTNLGIGPWWTGCLPFPGVKFVISGVTKNSSGVVLASCSVELYNTATDMPLERVTSDSAGNYAFSSVGGGQTYYVVAYKVGSPDVAGTTVNTLVGTTTPGLQAAAAYSFPQNTTVLDDFNRADASPMSANWTTTIGSFSVVSNAAGGGSADNFATWNPTTFNNDQEAWATVTAKGATFDRAGVFLRCASGGNCYFFVYSDQAGTDQYRIYKLEASSETQLGSSVVGPELTVGDKIGASAIGTTLKLYAFQSGAWANLISLTDSTFGTGKIGVYTFGAAARLDNFGGGSIV